MVKSDEKQHAPKFQTSKLYKAFLPNLMHYLDEIQMQFNFNLFYDKCKQQGWQFPLIMATL